jgi:DNA polymerase III delta prime subunit
MLPKIIVAGTYEKDRLLSSLGLSASSTMEYEGSEGKIDDLRHFVNFGINVSAGQTNFSLVIWNADRLSPECQAVLLKPLEDSADNFCLVLVAANENGLLSTIMSRCVVTNYSTIGESTAKYWKNVLECLAKGPAKCLSLADDLEKSEMEKTLEEVIAKLKSGLTNEVNKNRLKILKLAIDSLAKIRFTNINAKLAFGNFLISSWKLVRA